MSHVLTTPNYFVDDTIASLRTLYHPHDGQGMLQGVFQQLPPSLQKILDSRDVSEMIQDETRNLRYIAAALQFYRKEPRSHLWQDETKLNEHLKKVTTQNALILDYQWASKMDINISDKAEIMNILEATINGMSGFTFKNYDSKRKSLQLLKQQIELDFDSVPPNFKNIHVQLVTFAKKANQYRSSFHQEGTRSFRVFKDKMSKFKSDKALLNSFGTIKSTEFVPPGSRRNQ